MAPATPAPPPAPAASFLVAAEDAERLLASKPVRHRRGPRHGFEKTTYYDTPHHLLRKSGFALALRQAGGRSEQTIERLDAFPTDARPQVVVRHAGKSNLLDLDMLDEVPELAAITAAARARLQPVFHVQVRRTTLSPRAGAARVELAYEAGQVDCARTNRKIADISEITATLVSGPPAGLFQLLAKLNEKFPLAQIAASKALRGYAALRRSHALTPRKHGKDGPPADHDAFAVLQAAMADALGQYFANDLNLIADKPEAIHQTRVAVRRMRAILRAFKDEIDYIDRKALNGELRWLQTKLGECRDWFVLGEDTAPKMKKRHPDAMRALQRLAKQVHAKRLPQALEIYNSRRARRLILRIQLWLAGLPRHGGPDVAELRRDAMLRCLKRMHGFGRLTETKPINDVHGIRILAKKMRYALEIFPRAADVEDNAALKALKRMQEMLGDFNDAAKCLELISTARDSGLDPEIRTTIRLWAEKRMASRIKAARPHYNGVLRWGKELA